MRITYFSRDYKSHIKNSSLFVIAQYMFQETNINGHHICNFSIDYRTILDVQATTYKREINEL